MPLLALTPMVLGGLANIWGQRRAGREAERAQEQYQSNMESLLQSQQESLDKYIRPGMYENFMQSEQSQSALAAVRDQIQRQSQQLRGNVARTGATPEAEIAASSAGADQYSDIVNRLYGHGTTYRQQARDRYMQGTQNLMQQQAGLQQNLLGMGMQRAQNWSQFGQNIGQAGSAMSTALLSGEGGAIQNIRDLFQPQPEETQ